MAAVKLRDTISECLLQAQSDSHEAAHKALKTLVSITKVSPLNRNLVAKTDGAIPFLVTLLKSSSFPTLQTLCVSILFNLSLNPNLKLSLTTFETIETLNLILLSRSSPELITLAASLICSLAMLDKNKAMFGVANTIQTLVKLLSDPFRHVSAANHLLSCLSELVQFHGNSTLAIRSGAIQVLLKIVMNNECEDLAGTSLAILCLIAKFDEALSTLRKTEGIVSIMVEVLKERCMLSKEGAMELLLRLFNESEGCVTDALRLPDFNCVLADVSVRGSSRAREKASLLMRKMMEVADQEEGAAVFSRW